MKRKKKSFTGVDLKKFKEKIILFSKENSNSIFLNSNNNPKSYDFIFAYGQKSHIVSSFNSLEKLDEIMNIVQPFYWVKGSDYEEAEIRKKHPNLKNIKLIDLIKDKSTTNIIKKINQ